MRYTIRVDKLSEKDGLTLMKYLENYDKYLVYFEISQKTKKPHWQGVIDFPDMKTQKAAKTRLTTMFPEHTTGKKSMTSVKKDTYEVYISKDGDLFASAGYTQQEIEAYASKSYSKPDASGDAKTSFQRALDYCKQAGCHSTSSGWDICERLIDYYTDNVKCQPNDFQLKSMTKSIAASLKRADTAHPELYEGYRTKLARSIIGHEWIY